MAFSEVYEYKHHGIQTTITLSKYMSKIEPSLFVQIAGEERVLLSQA